MPRSSVFFTLEWPKTAVDGASGERASIGATEAVNVTEPEVENASLTKGNSTMDREKARRRKTTSSESVPTSIETGINRAVSQEIPSEIKKSQSSHTHASNSDKTKNRRSGAKSEVVIDAKDGRISRNSVSKIKNRSNSGKKAKQRPDDLSNRASLRRKTLSKSPSTSSTKSGSRPSTPKTKSKSLSKSQSTSVTSSDSAMREKHSLITKKNAIQSEKQSNSQFSVDSVSSQHKLRRSLSSSSVVSVSTNTDLSECQLLTALVQPATLPRVTEASSKCKGSNDIKRNTKGEIFISAKVNNAKKMNEGDHFDVSVKPKDCKYLTGLQENSDVIATEVCSAVISQDNFADLNKEISTCINAVKEEMHSELDKTDSSNKSENQSVVDRTSVAMSCVHENIGNILDTENSAEIEYTGNLPQLTSGIEKATHDSHIPLSQDIPQQSIAIAPIPVPSVQSITTKIIPDVNMLASISSPTEPTSTARNMISEAAISFTPKLINVNSHCNVDDDAKIVQQIVWQNKERLLCKPHKLRKALSDGSFSSPQVIDNKPDCVNYSIDEKDGFSKSISSTNKESCQQPCNFYSHAVKDSTCNLPVIGARLASCPDNPGTLYQCNKGCPQGIYHQKSIECTPQCGNMPISGHLCPSASPSPHAPCNCFSTSYSPNSYVSCQEHLQPYEYQHYNDTKIIPLKSPVLSNPYHSQAVPHDQMVYGSHRGLHSTPSGENAFWPHLHRYQPVPPNYCLPNKVETVPPLEYSPEQYCETSMAMVREQSPQPVPPPRITSFKKMPDDRQESPMLSRHGTLWTSCCQYRGISSVSGHPYEMTTPRMLPQVNSGQRSSSDTRASFETRQQNMQSVPFQTNSSVPVNLLHSNKPDLLSMDNSYTDSQTISQPSSQTLLLPSCLIIPCAGSDYGVKMVKGCPNVSPHNPVLRSKSCDSALNPMLFNERLIGGSVTQSQNESFNSSNYRSSSALSSSIASDASLESSRHSSVCVETESERTGSRSGTAYDSVNVSTNPSSINDEEEIEEEEEAVTRFDDAFCEEYGDADAEGYDKKKRVTFQLPSSAQYWNTPKSTDSTFGHCE